MTLWQGLELHEVDGRRAKASHVVMHSLSVPGFAMPSGFRAPQTTIGSRSLVAGEPDAPKSFRFREAVLKELVVYDVRPH